MLPKRGAQGAGGPLVPAQHCGAALALLNTLLIPSNPAQKGKASDPRAFRIAQAWVT